jgi:phosphate transport system permease protein
LTLPVIIVSAQEAIRAVPSSLRHAALALGATRWQTVWRVVLPSALPGILTGVILALCRAFGEAAALVLFGANLFVNHNPGLFSRFTVLPLQIFGWSDRPQTAWLYNAALASTILVGTLLLLNGTAIYLRHRVQGKGRL